jgi:hypothetical protein
MDGKRRIRMNHRGSSGFGNGVVVGMILGAVAVLLFTTKKGRKILRILSEDGFEKLKDWESIFDELQLDDEEEMDGDDYVAPVPVEKREMPRNPYLAKADTSTVMYHRVKPASRRLFRGIPKR